MPETTPFLTTEAVHMAFGACLSPSGEVTVQHLSGAYVRFSRDALAKQEPWLRQALAELPREFMKDGGGGWSFLNMCQRANGELWGDQPAVAELVALGEAVRLVKNLIPREMWQYLPGGVPYLMVDLDNSDQSKFS